MKVTQGTCNCNDISFGTVDDILDRHTYLVKNKESSSEHLIKKLCNGLSESDIFNTDVDKDKTKIYEKETCKVNKTL